uniref:Basic helix-loop-helix transcription factor n=2 Tax=Salvia miltiorrhiza TaxID=226208 RepID=A0A0H3YB37_SALMI|nr:basic helix-loop-helix transcription factor [Salvia miltiorrhiza]
MLMDFPWNWIISQLQPNPHPFYCRTNNNNPRRPCSTSPTATSSTITRCRNLSCPPPLPQFPAADFSTRICENAKTNELIRAEHRSQAEAAEDHSEDAGAREAGSRRAEDEHGGDAAIRHNYIKFLQAQVALLEFLGSHHQEVPFEGEEELQNLLESPLIQEKLYSTQHCLLPNNAGFSTLDYQRWMGALDFELPDRAVAGWNAQSCFWSSDTAGLVVFTLILTGGLVAMMVDVSFFEGLVIDGVWVGVSATSFFSDRVRSTLGVGWSDLLDLRDRLDSAVSRRACLRGGSFRSRCAASWSFYLLLPSACVFLAWFHVLWWGQVIPSSSMALSYYSNWTSFQQPDYSGDDPELQSLLNPDDYFADSFCNSLLCDDLTYHANGLPLELDNLTTATQPPPFLLPHQQQQSQAPLFHFPNRHKLYDYSLPEFVLPPPLPQFPAADFSTRICENAKNETSLSAQSIAARQRRRKITVKTQELGKLVPGGHRMNTAEMLQSAYNYVKFLQAQVALLEFLGSHHQEVPFEGEEELQNLLESPLIQEKLYSTQHCLLPNKLAEQVPLLKSNPHLLEKDH